MSGVAGGTPTLSNHVHNGAAFAWVGQSTPPLFQHVRNGLEWSGVDEAKWTGVEWTTCDYKRMDFLQLPKERGPREKPSKPM